jgi:hypothetical protein
VPHHARHGTVVGTCSDDQVRGKRAPEIVRAQVIDADLIAGGNPSTAISPEPVLLSNTAPCERE